MIVTKADILRKVWDAHRGSPKSWSIFNCRALVSIWLPSTVVEVYVGYLRRKIDVTVPPWAAMTSATIADPEPDPPPWPDPWPTTFGYHEFVHDCTALAVICQYIAMWHAVF
jgi:hypothetical protein